MVENRQGVLVLPKGKFVIPDFHPMLAGGAAALEAIGTRIRTAFIGGFWTDAAANGGVTLAFTAFAGFALAAAVFYTSRYDLRSTKEERDATKTKNRKEYEKLWRQCRQLFKHCSEPSKLSENCGTSNGGCCLTEGMDSPNSEYVVSARESLSSEEAFNNNEDECPSMSSITDNYECSKIITDSSIAFDSESSDSESSDDPEVSQTFDISEGMHGQDRGNMSSKDSSPLRTDVQSHPRSRADFATWQRIIRLDAIRANEEWTSYSLTQATVSEAKARRSAEAVRLKDYDHLTPGRIYHAARLVVILDAYALYDPETGYCQGMSDLLSPIITVVTEDHEAFWCFVGFMKKARHNFRLDEVGIRRQLNIVSKIIKNKNSHLYRHLEKL